MTIEQHPSKVLIFYNEGGGGHRAAAHALRDALHETQVAHATLVNPVQTLFQRFDWFPRWTSRSIEAYYNEVVLARSWGTIATTLYYGISTVNLTWYRRELIQGLQRLYAEHKPDLVISLLSGINHLFVESTRGSNKPPELVFINTDFQETFPYSWFPRSGDYYAITGTERSYQQARRTVSREGRVFRATGMPVRASFYAAPVADIASERVRLGLDPDKLTLCVVYGGAGSHRMRLLAEWMNHVDHPLQVIFLCGSNRELLDELAGLELRYPRLLVPYTKDIAHYFDLADGVIGKSGPGFISEALVRRRPLLIDRSSVMPQERYNLAWVLEAGVGLPFASRKEFVRALRTLCDDGHRAQLVKRCERHENRAIFEIPEMLRGLLEQRGRGVAPGVQEREGQSP